MQLEADFRGADRERSVGRERKGSAAQFHRVNSQQQVMHDRIADQCHLEDVIDGNPGLACDFGCKGVEGAVDRFGHLLRTTRIHHRVGHAAHQVFTEADLRIHRAG